MDAVNLDSRCQQTLEFLRYSSQPMEEFASKKKCKSVQNPLICSVSIFYGWQIIKPIQFSVKSNILAKKNGKKKFVISFCLPFKVRKQDTLIKTVTIGQNGNWMESLWNRNSFGLVFVFFCLRLLCSFFSVVDKFSLLTLFAIQFQVLGIT